MKRWVLVFGVAGTIVSGSSSAWAVETTVTVTQYVYNVDGALTRITEQTDDGPERITFLVWDNFTPDETDPSQGVVAPGNGNLRGVGPSTDPADFTTTFEFDTRNRLTRVIRDARGVSYRYHATWLLAESTLDSGDALRFYYDTRANPQVVSLEQVATGDLQSRLGPLSAVTDGERQLLIAPRKDVAGVYRPDTGDYASYGESSPYGESVSDEAEPGYDADENPFRYAGEYRDPTWGGYFLRSRWYDPSLQLFVSRDRYPTLNRFGYTAGNPVSRIDPSGFKHASYRKIMKPLSRFVQRNNRDLYGVPLSRIALGTVFAPLALIADPAGFYYQQIGPDHGERLWVALGSVAIDAATDGLLGEEAGLFAESVELAVEGVTGVANAQAAATSHNFHRFSQEEFFSDLSFAAGTVVQAKALSTVGLQPISGYENHLLPWEEIPTSSQLAEIFRVGRGEQEEEGAEHEAERAHREPIERYHRALADLQGTRRKLPGFLAQNLRPDVPGPGPGSIQASETRYDPMASRFEPGDRLPRRAPVSGALSRRFVQIHAPTIEAPTAYDLLQRNAALHAESLLRNVH